MMRLKNQLIGRGYKLICLSGVESRTTSFHLDKKRTELKRELSLE